MVHVTLLSMAAAPTILPVSAGEVEDIGGTIEFVSKELQVAACPDEVALEPQPPTLNDDAGGCRRLP